MPGSLRKKSELSSHQMAHPGQLRTKIRAESSSNGSCRVSFGQNLPEFHDSGEKAQELMKEFFVFNLIGFAKTSPLGLATLYWTSSLRFPLIAVLFGPGRITVAVLGVLSPLFTALDVLLWTFYFSGMAVLTLRGTLRRQPNF